MLPTILFVQKKAKTGNIESAALAADSMLAAVPRALGYAGEAGRVDFSRDDKEKVRMLVDIV